MLFTMFRVLDRRHIAVAEPDGFIIDCLDQSQSIRIACCAVEVCHSDQRQFQRVCQFRHITMYEFTHKARYKLNRNSG
jgi:hypothetical protein